MRPSESLPAPVSPPSSDATSALVRHFPEAVRDAYQRFQATRDPADADVVILAVVVDHLPDKQARSGSAPADRLALIADLGFDSVAITELVFFIEDLFQVKIGNDEIMRVQTVGDLRRFVREKIAALPPSAHA